MQALELRVPPVAVWLLFGMLMWFISGYEPSLAFELPWRNVIAMLFYGAGSAIALAGVLEFLRAKTTVNPVAPEATTAMVTSGVYRVSRNPMYLGLLLILVGWGVWLSHYLALVLLPFFILYLNRFQIAPEERALSAKFGRQFEDYARSVGRWL